MTAMEFSTLKRVSLFSRLEERELTALLQVSVVRRFPKNTIIITKTENSHAFYLIKKGKIKVVLHDEHGKEIILAVLGEGEYFGEMALVDDGPRSATVMTKEACEFMIISQQALRGLFKNHSGIVMELLSELSRRLRAANKKIEGLALMDVYGRVARFLLDNAVSQENGESKLEGKWTHQEIANTIGTSREMVCRILNDLSAEGFIRVQERRITLCRSLPISL